MLEKSKNIKDDREGQTIIFSDKIEAIRKDKKSDQYKLKRLGVYAGIKVLREKEEGKSELHFEYEKFVLSQAGRREALGERAKEALNSDFFREKYKAFLISRLGYYHTPGGSLAKETKLRNTLALSKK